MGNLHRIIQQQKGHLIYISSARKIIPSHDIVFDKAFSIAFVYILHSYLEALVTRSEVSYTTYVLSFNKQNGDIIPFTQFEEGIQLEKVHNLLEDRS